jgi:two-component system CheB/CheR fusion protein
VLVNIDERKRVERAITEGRDYAEAVIRTVPDPLVVLTDDLRVQSANDAFYRDFKREAAETEGHSIFELGHGAWNIPQLRNLLDGIIAESNSFDEFEVTHDFERLGRRAMLLNARALVQAEGKTKLILLGIRDVTEPLAFQAELRANAEELARFNRAAVGRELRMIELKKEINELCRRQGEPARYPLEFEREEGENDD